MKKCISLQVKQLIALIFKSIIKQVKINFILYFSSKQTPWTF